MRKAARVDLTFISQKTFSVSLFFNQKINSKNWNYQEENDNRFRIKEITIESKNYSDSQRKLSLRF